MRHLLASMIVLFLAVSPLCAEPVQWQTEGWNKTDFNRSSVVWAEILSGGPSRDGIPPIDDPKFRPVAEVNNLADAEPVISLALNGDARAYPLQVLMWHEIANDTIGGTPVAVTYCPLCNAAIVFDRRVKGRVLDFGTTGKLRNSDLIMYDRQTESWWQQFTGEAIVGEMLGAALTIVPSRLQAFAEFRQENPQGMVLVPNNPAARPYGKNPYVAYDTSVRPFLYAGDLPTGIDAMARVVVVRREGQKPLIVAMEKVRSSSPYREGRVELTWSAGQSSALDVEQISEGRDVGTVLAHDVATDGSRKPVAYEVTFAFVAHAFHSDVAIIQ